MTRLVALPGVYGCIECSC